jgi:DNA-binding HxlR family transcriptional regulator
MTDPQPRPGAHPADLPLEVRSCPLAAALEVLGERWSLLVVREIGYGVHRFARIAGYTGVSRDILADRLRKLEAAGVVERRLYSEHPPRYEYHLTLAGTDLLPITFALSQWGGKWLADTRSISRRHSCGQPVQIEVVCHHCGPAVTHDTIRNESAAA